MIMIKSLLAPGLPVNQSRSPSTIIEERQISIKLYFLVFFQTKINIV